MDPLVTTDWLAQRMAAADAPIIVDASYTSTLPGSPRRDARVGYFAEHIPGALFLDLDTLTDPASDLPSTLPPADVMARRLGSLGIDPSARIVLYDDVPYHTATRAWWLMRAYGVDGVALLDGGLARWKAEGRALASGAEPAVFRPVSVALDPQWLRTLPQLRDGDEPVIDARSAARFSGEEDDPRAGVAPGHIPGSANLPYGRLLNPDGSWKRGDALAAVFRDAGVDPTRPFVATCGSGITACVVAFGAHLLGGRAAVYDGSWSEWGADPATPKALGPT